MDLKLWTTKTDFPARFWARVAVCEPDDCWEWRGGTNNTGYGSLSVQNKTYTAHRVAAWLDGLVDSPSRPKDLKGGGFVLHRCDNRRCCNPAHFFLGSYTDNLLDAYTKGRKTPPKGDQHVNAKLSSTQVAEIRETYVARKATQVQLAARYGVTQTTISLVVRGETYR